MSLMDKLPKWVKSNKFYFSQAVQEGKIASDSEEFEKSCTDRKEVSIFDANLISSRVRLEHDVVHYPMLDIDVGAALIPSSTPGHSHLYIDKSLTWEQYHKLLTVLHECGIIQTGVLNAAEKRQETCLRLPWIKKPEQVEID